MTIYINDKGLSVETNSTLFSVLEQTGFSNQYGIAVAVNNSVVPRSQWENQVLSEGYKVLVIQATKGG